MWHGCIPIATPVSCVPWMLNNETYRNTSAQEILAANSSSVPRGIVHADTESTIEQIEYILRNKELFSAMSQSGQDFSHQYTTEKFEAAIKSLLHS
jgi:glycosyltransferase involved in cell wall biosynthesis